MGTSVQWSCVDGVAEILLNRPRQGNAISMDLARATRQAADEIAALADAGEARVVLLRGAGPAFCVGGDLTEFAAAGDPSAHIAQLAQLMHDAIIALVESPAPVISVVHGVAAGAGVGIALTADLVIATTEARFRAAYTGVGLSPDCGVSWLLGTKLGHAVGLDLALTNRAVAADEARQYGLVSRVVAAAELERTVAAVVEALKSGPPLAMAATKRLVREASESSLRAHLAEEAASIAALAGEPDGREGVAAFLAKRPPVYTGALSDQAHKRERQFAIRSTADRSKGWS
jgi:2-(1,2-epoxy-1,2-dihydrophenyl)acetyl-CoA isomerase